MPDRWGRITADDWGAATGMINQIQAMGQRNTAFNNRQKDREADEKLRSDIETNYQGYKAGPQPVPYGDGNIYDAPGEMKAFKGVGTGQAQVEGKQLYAQDLQADQAIEGQRRSKAVTEKENELWRKIGAMSPEDRDAFFEGYTPQSREDFMAFQTVGESLEANDQVRHAKLKKNADKGTQLFKKYNSTLRGGLGFLKKGITPLAERYLEAAVNESHHPLAVQKNTNGTYDLVYEEMGKPPITIGDDITLEQAYKKALDIPAKAFVSDFVGQRAAIAKLNREAPWVQWAKGKETYDVKTVYDPEHPVTGRDVIYKKGGGIATKEDGSPMTVADLTSNGFRPMRSHDRANQGGEAQQMAAMTKAYQTAFKNAAEVFKPSGSSTGTEALMKSMESGEQTPETQNMYQAMLDYYHGNKGKKLEGAARDKFKVAEKGIEAMRMLYQITAPKPGPDTPPVDGARKAKDGFWYVRQGDGWSRVHTGKDGHSPQRIAAEVSGTHGERTAMGGPGEDLPVEPPQPQVEANSPAIRPELPQDISTWNVKIIPQNGRQIPVVITERGPIPLTPEEIELYKQFSSQQRNQAIGAGVDWFQKNATGTQQLPQ